MYFLNHFMLTLKHSLILLTLTLATDNGLRIPIRGYEDAYNAMLGKEGEVTNPYKGL